MTLKLEFKYNTILSKQVSMRLLKVKQKHFELADKPDKLLARQLRNIQANGAIRKIKTETGTISTDLKKMNDCFRKFYEELYTSTADISQISDFFHALHLPKLSPTAQTDLNSKNCGVNTLLS